MNASEEFKHGIIKRVKSVELCKYGRMAFFRASLNKNPQRATSEAYFRWKIERNPFGAGHIALERRGSIDVGSATITPKRIHVFGEVVSGAEIGDTFTLRNYQRQGIFSRCVTECREYALRKGMEIVYGTPNDQSLPGYQKKLGLSACPHAHVIRMGKPFQWNGKGDTEANRRKLISFLRSQAPLPVQDGTTVRTLQRFGEDENGLWGPDRFAFAMLRNWAYIQWRYLDNPDDYHLLGVYNNSVCLGYLVLKVAPIIRTGFICDFITLNDDANTFNHLLASAEKRLKEAGVNWTFVLTTKGSAYYRELFKAGYVVLQENVPVIVYGGSRAGNELLKNEGPWHFTFGDTDAV